MPNQKSRPCSDRGDLLMHTIEKYSVEDKATNMEDLNDSSTIDERMSKVTCQASSKATGEVIAVHYPLSFLLLESEEGSFVKGYN